MNMELDESQDFLNIEEIDGTNKIDDQIESEKVLIHQMLDYYCKNRKEKDKNYEED